MIKSCDSISVVEGTFVGFYTPYLKIAFFLLIMKFVCVCVCVNRGK